MTTSPHVDPEAWGIALRFRDAGGLERAVPEETVDALLQAMRAEQERPPHAKVVTTQRRERRLVPGAAEVITEDGETVAVVDDRLPAQLPDGYHRLTWRDGTAPARLVVGPGRCHIPEGLRAWGWAVQLYALRSRSSWGMGDLADLTRLMRWSRVQGAEMTLLNPLHAVSPGTPQQPSPYYPGSRLWRNPLYLRIEDVPDAADAGLALEKLAASGRALNRADRIDRDEIYRLKLDALELLWERSGGEGGGAFEAYRTQHDPLLEGFATFAALVERFGPEPRGWPHAFRHPDTADVKRFRADNASRVRFHSWLQWLLDRQLAEASSEGGLVQDLAIGVNPSGADAWLWQDLFPRDVTVGAPPDAFNSRGQDWGVLAFDPWRLRDAEYEPFVQTVRWSLASGGGLRFDHVMGLWRLFWIPAGAPPADGGYVRYPTRELLDILALESSRAGAYVVGEDLGTVEPIVRQEMNARAMLSYKLLWFEDAPPSGYPRRALAAVTNHDLPTVAGLWTGADLAAQKEMDLEPDDDAYFSLRRRVRALTGLAEDDDARDAVEAVYRLLAEAPSALLAATLEDALVLRERQNHPGTTTQWPNWSIPLPLALEDLQDDDRVRSLGEILSR